MSKKRKKANKPKPKVYAPEGLEAILSEQEHVALLRRINRRRGGCAICGEILGRRKDLALTIAPHKVEDLESLKGTWQIVVTHRDCRKESVQDIASLNPKHTYTTTLLAIPVISAEGLPQQVPALLVNPSVDHVLLYKGPGGKVVDQTVKHLEEEVGFARMGHSDDDRAPEVPGLQAYVTGADVTVAANEFGISWTHEQPDSNNAVVDRLAASLRTLLEKWDNTLLVMVSTKFKANDPNRLMRELPELIRDGYVYTAPATVEYKESNFSLVEKAMAVARQSSAHE